MSGHIQNEARYEAGKQAAIARNRRVGGRRRFLENVADAQELIDFLEGNGEFDDIDVCKDPADQQSYDEQKAAIMADESLSWLQYHQDLNDLADRFEVRVRPHPVRKGMFGGNFGGMMQSMLDALDEWGGLTEKQAQIVRNSLAKRRQWAAEADERFAAQKAADAKGVWVGEIKERREFELTVKKVFEFESQWGYTFINLCKDADNNTIVYKGSICLDEGETIKLVATVKAHETREGVKQTLIARPKIK